MTKRFCILLSAIILCCNIILSQDCIDKKVTIKMLKTKDGTTIFGNFINSNDSVVSISTNSLGILNIPTSQILSNNDVVCSRMKSGEYWYENPSNNFYLIAPTTLSPGKGNFYFRNSFLFFNFLGYGITDNFSINAGFDFLTLFNKNSYYSHNPAFMIMPKVDYQVTKNLRLGSSLIFINDNGNYNDESILILLINSTYGDEDKNLSFGVGYDMVDKYDKNYDMYSGLGYYSAYDSRIKVKPIERLYISIGGFYRISNRIGLEVEINKYQGYRDYLMVGYGLKFINRKMSVDFGFVNNSVIFNQFLIGFPTVSFTLKR